MYWKDTEGKYLAGNAYIANHAGLSRKSQLLGLTDFDLPWSAQASLMQLNDTKVITQNKTITFIESSKTYTGEIFRFASLKAPLKSSKNKITGVIGLSFLIEEENNLPFQHLPKLSKQQNKCLYYLAQGMTMKQIASTLKLSPKTVEHYLETVKLKLKCQSRSELVAYAIEMGFLEGARGK